jgi:hypothetical protein
MVDVREDHGERKVSAAALLDLRAQPVLESPVVEAAGEPVDEGELAQAGAEPLFVPAAAARSGPPWRRSTRW